MCTYGVLAMVYSAVVTTPSDCIEQGKYHDSTMLHTCNIHLSVQSSIHFELLSRLNTSTLSTCTIPSCFSIYRRALQKIEFPYKRLAKSWCPCRQSRVLREVHTSLYHVNLVLIHRPKCLGNHRKVQRGFVILFVYAQVSLAEWRRGYKS